MVFLLSLAIIVLGTFSNVPRINERPNVIRPLFTFAQEQLLQVDFGVDSFWVAKGTFEIKSCSGRLLIIEGSECSDLPTRVTEGRGLIYYQYFLPGSIVNITVQENLSNSELQIWMFNSLGWRQTNLGLELGSCDEPVAGSSCFLAQSYAGQTHQVLIKKADFYFFIFHPFGTGIEFAYMGRQFNATEIYRLYSPREFSIVSDSPNTIDISRPFDFQRRKCVLLSSDCSAMRNYDIVINQLKRRMDFLLFPGITGIILLLVAALLISICIFQLVKNKKSG